MSRSFRKTPIAGIATSPSDKDFKVAEHRRARTIERTALRSGKEDELHPKATGNPWKSNKDGKRWFGNHYPELLRK